ncbi:unnamed protein product [Mytilus edulis]|uniref:Endonuclease/exonuclease/phosphatase domain-containing protein n=1 Tax=Mytilus edulis TaxID=6550 RepID=A0A8S3USN8_MYTED|nr:unnamed protein product [Mytilus edulis]
MKDMKIEINNIKATQEQQAHTLAKEENHHYIIEDRVKSMEQVNTYLENENFELKEQFLRLQTHSMKYNLIFSGITEQDNESKEDTESVIKNFIETELEIRDANTISFQNVHRLRPRNDGKPRNIIAKFSKYDDHQRVIRVVPAKLRHKSHTDSDYVQWFEISPELTGLRVNILVGGVYIPPEYSKYSTDNAFSEIETEMMQFSENASSIILLGDFNARTATMPDFIVPDDTLFDILDLTDNQDVDTLKNMYSYNFLLDYNIPLQRSSEDKKSNGFGSKLIDMCKRCSLYIANGRLFDDTIGKTTCKNVSLIDYLIISPDLFNYITNFNVLDFDPMISDVHNRIHFTLSFQTLKQVNPKNINDLDHTKIKWNPVHANQFQQVLSNRLGEIDSALDDLDNNHYIQVSLF